MKIVKFNKDNHYKTLKGFWEQYDWSAPKIEYLPKTGYVSKVGGEIIAACFYYRTNSQMAILDWLIADRNSDRRIREMAIVKLIKKIKAEAVLKGFSVLYTISGNARLIETYEGHGFEMMERDAYTMAWSKKDLAFLGD